MYTIRMLLKLQCDLESIFRRYAGRSSGISCRTSRKPDVHSLVRGDMWLCMRLLKV